MLHQCAEKDLQMFIKAGNTTTCFSDFCSRLAGLTRWSPSHWFPSLEQYVYQTVKVHLQNDTCLWMCYFLIERKADMDTGLVCLHLHISGRLWPVYRYVPLFVFSLFLFADFVVQSWISILVIRSSLNSIQVDLYYNCGEVLFTSKIFWHPLLCSRELEEIPKESRG
jgi:hypothetical protein